METGRTSDPAMVMGAVGSEEDRHTDTHHMTSVLIALSRSRLDHIQTETAPEQEGRDEDTYTK